MSRASIGDAINYGNGVAGRELGAMCHLHRPHDAGQPIRAATLLMQLPAHFEPLRQHSSGYGHPLYTGLFDAGYTRPGDYLRGAGVTWFIASQVPLWPVLCVRATRTVSLVRATQPGSVGLSGYGGLVRANAAPVLTGWPASLLAGGMGLDRVGLPGDAGLGGWSVLLPATGRAVIRSGDLLTDDLGRAGVVASAELSELGWRLDVRQAAT